MGVAEFARQIWTHVPGHTARDDGPKGLREALWRGRERALIDLHRRPTVRPDSVAPAKACH